LEVPEGKRQPLVALSDHNRSNVGGVIAPRSTPTFFDAMAKAGLEHPTCLEEDGGARFLELVAVVDHELVGSGVWYDEILGDTRHVTDQSPDR
jgi:hypothetical protein